VREFGGIAALVGLLAPGRPAGVQEQAARALRNLCADSKEGQDSVRECGGIAALEGLLVAGGPATVRAEAAAALSLALPERMSSPALAHAMLGSHGAGGAAGARRF